MQHLHKFTHGLKTSLVSGNGTVWPSLNWSAVGISICLLAL